MTLSSIGVYVVTRRSAQGVTHYVEDGRLTAPICGADVRLIGHSRSRLHTRRTTAEAPATCAACAAIATARIAARG